MNYTFKFIIVIVGFRVSLCTYLCEEVGVEWGCEGMPTCLQRPKEGARASLTF
jgi:hypothetical protein